MDIKTYQQKINAVHTPEEIKEAFDTSFAVCFNIESDVALGKISLFTSIWDINPDVLIKEVDLCVFSPESKAFRKQFMLINKNGSKESSNEIVKLIEESGIITSVYCFFSEKKAGIKGCYRRVFGIDKPSVVKKGNLLIDGDKLLVTVRSQTESDREKIQKINHTRNREDK